MTFFISSGSEIIELGKPFFFKATSRRSVNMRNMLAEEICANTLAEEILLSNREEVFY